jgi:hypothetical protein
MKLNDVVEALLKLGIHVSVDEDLEGQVILFTGLKLDDDENLIEFEEE